MKYMQMQFKRSNLKLINLEKILEINCLSYQTKASKIFNPKLQG